MPRRSAGPSREILEAALHGLESQKQRLDEQIAHVRSLMGQRSPGRPSKKAANGSGADTQQKSAGGGRKRRSLSPEARKRIAAAQKKRWAAFRKSQ